MDLLGPLIAALAMVIVAIPFLVLVWWGCFLGAWELLAKAKKHQPATELDNWLPLRGRWLHYVAAALFILSGVVVLCLIVFFALVRSGIVVLG